MINYSYKAHDRQSGKDERGFIEAGSQAEAISALKKRGLLPIEVKEEKKPALKAGKLLREDVGSEFKFNQAHVATIVTTLIGFIEAGSQAEAISALKKRGLLPIEVKEEKKPALKAGKLLREDAVPKGSPFHFDKHKVAIFILGIAFFLVFLFIMGFKPPSNNSDGPKREFVEGFVANYMSAYEIKNETPCPPKEALDAASKAWGSLPQWFGE